MARTKKIEEPVKTTRKPRTKKVVEPVVEKKQYEVPVIEEETEEVIFEPVEEPAAAPEINSTEYIVKVREDSWLNVRPGPGTSYPSIGKLYAGDTVTVYEKKGSWGRIGTGKWVSMDYLK